LLTTIVSPIKNAPFSPPLVFAKLPSPIDVKSIRMIINSLKTDSITKLLVSILLGFSVLHTSLAARKDEIIDIVFDLDWTLISEIEDNLQDHGEVLEISGKKYRMSNWAKEMLTLLADRPNVRISFYSGGDDARNTEILKKTILPGKNVSAFDLAYKVLSKDDMEEVSNDTSLRFSQRFKKNVGKINKNLGNIILIDDVLNFLLENQQGNLLWLGPTFNHYQTYELVKEARRLDPTNKYIPKNKAQWKLNHDKLIIIYGIIDEALEATKNNQKSFAQNVQSVAKKYKLEHAAYNHEITKLVKKYQPILKSARSQLQTCLQFIYQSS